ncbi:hypothetical protein KC19_2G241900 [Ceratodon purpureus]|uniref:Uncharacterized protein n=1 Tax=Ceratodon purpureus TaxID=3225 RepID=A0A8T0IYM1_CERPU|nr:hypothetical protein KC19_2G241900 [Ceratodon purpureus]
MWRWRAGRRLGLRMLHNGPETLEELVERHVVKPAKGQRHPTAGLTTSRREALGLYREILRTTRLFTWTNEQGVAWYVCDVGFENMLLSLGGIYCGRVHGWNTNKPVTRQIQRL